MNYMRIQVEYNVDLPLKKGKNIILGNGTQTLVLFKYERLQIFYFICGKLGHLESYCDIPYETKSGEIRRDWGKELRPLTAGLLRQQVTAS
ncbi:hypothetical protein ACS0TY_021141 [Phlomoides rotata]